MNLLIQLICLLSLVNIRGSAAAAVNIASQHTVCLTAEECYEQSKVLSIIGITSFSAGVYDGMYGCFFRGNTAYFGFGGSDEDMSRVDLDGIRIFCATSTSTDADSQVDVTTITSTPTTSPTDSPPPPSQQPSNQPSPVRSVSAVTTQSPSRLPSANPTRSPTATPSSKPSTAPTRLPSSSPSFKPTAQPSNLPEPPVTCEDDGIETCQGENSCFDACGKEDSRVKAPCRVSCARHSNTKDVSRCTIIRGNSIQYECRNPRSDEVEEVEVVVTKIPPMAPSRAPSSSPSLKPTMKPSISPSSEPTKNPTNGPTIQPTMAPMVLEPLETETGTVCSNQKMCNQMRRKLGFEKYMVGSYTSKGCWNRNGIAYYGVGGTLAQQSKFNLQDGKQRIFCDGLSVPTEDDVNPPPLEQTEISMDEEKEEDLDVEIGKKYCIDIELATDKYGKETGLELSTNPKDGSQPEKLVDYPIGSLQSETIYAKKVCVPAGTYTFTIRDTFRGICCKDGKGSYSIKLDGDEIISGGYFTEKAKTYDILAGYEQDMSVIDKVWLEGHNSRREAFHQQHGKQYRPLKWSQELANDASQWVDKMLPTCKELREPNLEEGENMSFRTMLNKNDPEDNPETILKRWSDEVLDKEQGFSNNLTLTQFMWRGTRYVGCSNKYQKNPDGSYCYVSICRYSRPGNCSLGSYPSWLEATLSDRTPCGKPCAEEGCY